MDYHDFSRCWFWFSDRGRHQQWYDELFSPRPKLWINWIALKYKLDCFVMDFIVHWSLFYCIVVLCSAIGKETAFYVAVCAVHGWLVHSPPWCKVSEPNLSTDIYMFKQILYQKPFYQLASFTIYDHGLFYKSSVVRCNSTGFEQAKWDKKE